MDSFLVGRGSTLKARATRAAAATNAARPSTYYTPYLTAIYPAPRSV